MGIQRTALTLQGDKLITIFCTLSFALEKLLVGHILNKIIVIWYFNPRHFLKTSKLVAGHVTKMWLLKLWITSFWTQILHFNCEENVKRIIW